MPRPPRPSRTPVPVWSTSLTAVDPADLRRGDDA
jgi:hypothetical protein